MHSILVTRMHSVKCIIEVMYARDENVWRQRRAPLGVHPPSMAVRSARAHRGRRRFTMDHRMIDDRIVATPTIDRPRYGATDARSPHPPSSEEAPTVKSSLQRATSPSRVLEGAPETSSARLRHRLCVSDASSGRGNESEGLASSSCVAARLSLGRECAVECELRCTLRRISRCTLIGRVYLRSRESEHLGDEVAQQRVAREGGAHTAH
jgi:hypothetical protein